MRTAIREQVVTEAFCQVESIDPIPKMYSSLVREVIQIFLTVLILEIFCEESVLFMDA